MAEQWMNVLAISHLLVPSTPSLSLQLSAGRCWALWLHHLVLPWLLASGWPVNGRYLWMGREWGLGFIPHPLCSLTSSMCFWWGLCFFVTTSLRYLVFQTFMRSPCLGNGIPSSCLFKLGGSRVFLLTASWMPSIPLTLPTPAKAFSVNCLITP